MNAADAPACPACGFHVYNRRYPRCESCGAELPVPLVYSDAEREALLANDAALELAVARRDSTPGATTTATPTLDDAVMGTLLDLTER